MLKREDIRIRDPFVLTDKENGCYYLYGTINLVENSTKALPLFSVYKSRDLEEFEEAKVIFDGRKDSFWADTDYWAPEVHKYCGKYYLFGSLKADNKCRATQIFVCDTPDGEYVPLTDKPITPENWECLDGTLYIENGVPYIVFCHEWLQVGDGEMWAAQLTPDLKQIEGEPFMLFSASQNKSASPLKLGKGNYVTDGPFLYKEDGKLKMIWSSYGGGKYLVLSATSNSIRDVWVQEDAQFDFDGGHAMLFETLEGERMIALHAPNTVNLERFNYFKF